MRAEELLPLALEAAVPLWQRRWRAAPVPDKALRAQELVDVLASRGDLLQFRSETPGGTAEAFNGLAEAIALLTLLRPGEPVRMLGRAWWWPA